MPGLQPQGMAGPMPPPRLGPTGPASPATPNLGAQAQALAKVQQAVQLLSLQLPAFPVGSEEQKAVMDAIGKLSKIAPADAAPQGLGMNSIDQLQEDAKATAMLRMIMANAGKNATGAVAPQPAGPPGTLPGMV